MVIIINAIFYLISKLAVYYSIISKGLVTASQLCTWVCDCSHLSECGGEGSQVGHDAGGDQHVSSEVIVLLTEIFGCLPPSGLLPSKTTD